MNATATIHNPSLREAEVFASIRRGWVVDAAGKAALLQMEKPDGWRFTLWALFHFSIYSGALTSLFWFDHWSFKAGLAILLANQLHALTILQHDCGHGSAYASRATNLWVGRFFSFFIFLPFSAFQEVHKWHHWFLGDPKRDPDEWYYAGGPRQLWFREMLFMPYFTILPLIRYGAEVRNRVLRELITHIVLWSVGISGLILLGQLDFLIWGIALPMAGLAFIISPISRGFEHYPLSTLPQGDKKRFDLHQNSVTLTSSLMGFLWVNITLHVEHHLFPRIPFFSLRKAYRILSQNNVYQVCAYPLQKLKDPSDFFVNRGVTSDPTSAV
jgi:beta-carotene hydroxylase